MRAQSPLSISTKHDLDFSPQGHRKATRSTTSFEVGGEAKGGGGVNGAENGGHHTEFDSKYKVPNAEQWLALRVQGGSRHWPKLPNCFQND